MRASFSSALGFLIVALLAPLGSVAKADSPPAPASVEVTYRLVGKVAPPPEWDLILRPVPEGKEPAVRHRVQSGEPLVLQLPAGSSWEVSADVPGFWVRRQSLIVGRPSEKASLELQLWPLGTISGRIEARQKGVELPKAVTVKTMAVPAFLQRSPVPPGVLDCPIDKAGSWSCSLPAAKFDLVIAAKGFIPHYRWEVEVPPAKTLALGTFQLERGSSASAWIAVERRRH